jgi:DNA-binding NarL/FixJ family response regulator
VGPWAEVATRQLRATGESTGRRPTTAELNPRELQIALLAAQGLSNRDIGQRLFLSPRTVGSYLYRIYPRLGITARAQLAGALAASGIDKPAP